jgi:hypothetical protein
MFPLPRDGTDSQETAKRNNISVIQRNSKTKQMYNLSILWYYTKGKQ